MCPSFFSSFSKSALNAASASTIASKDFFTSAGKSSALMFCHFNSSRAMVLLQLGRTKRHTLIRDQTMVCTGLAFGSTAPEKSARRASGAGPGSPDSGRNFKPMVPVATRDEPTFFAERSLWNIDGGSASLRLDVEGPDHLGPLLGFVGDQRTKVGGRARKRRAAEVSEPRFDRGIGQAGVDVLVEPIRDLGRRVLGRADAEPNTCLVARHELTHGRNIGQ